jgi:poly-gamma-glutamate synthesis protein (capsule biosynthesis protein)
MITILACGDVGVKRADLATIFAGCAPTLQRADLCLAQLETTISNRGARVPNARLAMRAPPAMAAAARAAGISVMSFAGNHCLDFGYEAFEDTLRLTRESGIAVCGAGTTLELARRAVIMDCAGVKVAVLAVNAILPEGYAAEFERPGCAPLRAHTVYEPIEPDQPGTSPRIRSFAHRGDLGALVEGIRQARTHADAVLLSIHWGIHMVRSTLADYQIEVAHAAIDAGADAIFGHHPHLLKGVEFYRDKPIFYSLGNFAIEQPHIWDPAITQSASFRHLVSLNPTWRMDQVYMLPPVTRLTGLAKLVRDDRARWEVRFLPAWIDDDSAPRILDSADPRFAEVAAFIADSSREAQLNCEVVVAGDELLLRSRRS